MIKNKRKETFIQKGNVTQHTTQLRSEQYLIILKEIMNFNFSKIYDISILGRRWAEHNVRNLNLIPPNRNSIDTL